MCPVGDASSNGCRDEPDRSSSTEDDSDLLGRDTPLFHEGRQEWRGDTESCVQQAEQEQEGTYGREGRPHHLARRLVFGFRLSPPLGNALQRLGVQGKPKQVDPGGAKRLSNATLALPYARGSGWLCVVKWLVLRPYS
jgi:hypothetical protein